MTSIHKQLLASLVLAASAFGGAHAQVHVITNNFNIFDTPGAETSAGLDFSGATVTGTETWASIDSFAHYGGDWNPNASFGALVSATIQVATTGSHTFTLGSDDASYLFIDGNLVGSLPGHRAYGTANFSSTLTAGLHTVQVQFYNSFCCGSRLSVDLGPDVSIANPVPEPESWALLLAGLGLLGARIRQRKPEHRG